MEARIETLQRIEREREKLHLLIEKSASKEEVQRQSEMLDKCIVKSFPRAEIKIEY